MATASGDVTVTWTDGENADRHIVALFTDDDAFELVSAERDATGETQSFDSISAGDYVVVVIAFVSSTQYEAAFGTVTVPAN